MNATQPGSCEESAPLVAAGDGIIDFAPPSLGEDVTLREAAAQLVESGALGIAVLDRGGRYLGTCTLRSIVAGALPVMADTAPSELLLRASRPGAAGSRLRAALERPVTQGLDVEVPVVRLSTSLPHLLIALCRRSPVVPIVSDAGMCLLGMATLPRALRALCAP
ncbi:MAG TPA: CBS domain-containing protein [Stellaceae bacterium]|jgi:CBS domain-containing protein|nr:CBS domain-containing protein [Stellaceae bacterium]